MDVYETFPVDRLDTIHDDLNRMMRLVDVGHQSTIIEAIMLCDTVKHDHREHKAQAALVLHGRVECAAEAIDYEVLAVKKCGPVYDPTIVVLAVRKKSTVIAPEPFVTWVWSEGAGFVWGHYYREERNAEADFAERCAKYDS